MGLRLLGTIQKEAYDWFIMEWDVYRSVTLYSNLLGLVKI